MRLNLATALIHDAQTNGAKRGDDLNEAGALLNDLLAKDLIIRGFSMLRQFFCTKPALQRKLANRMLRRLRSYFEKPLHDITSRRNSTWRSSNSRVVIQLKELQVYSTIFNVIR